MDVLDSIASSTLQKMNVLDSIDRSIFQNMNILDPIDSSTFQNMNLLDSIDSSTFQNMNVQVCIDCSTFQNMLEFILTYIIHKVFMNVNIMPFINYGLPKLVVLLSRLSFITKSRSIESSLCWFTGKNCLYSCGVCQAAEEACCLLLHGIYINHESYRACSSRMQELCLCVCDNVHNLIQATRLQA